jgi:hypothetical protein
MDLGEIKRNSKLFHNRVEENLKLRVVMQTSRDWFRRQRQQISNRYASS